MTDTQAQLEDLFTAAVELPPADQERFLDECCRDDPALRRELQELLASDRAAGEYFDELAGSIVAAAPGELESAARPRVEIGPYRALDLIGRGGMGVVYRAIRVDGEFDQEVALKLLHLDMQTPQMRARFLAERQLLARLSDPNVAHLLDGGVTEEGRPYFVMEHVEGVRVTRYCRDHALTLDQTLRLFLDVIGAVSYLHRNLIVHRDLKPGNIFVDDEGHVKLLDFGIAKLLAEDSELGGRTRTGEQMLTPDYAAPEQLLGKRVTTATDVYALGGVLYELLTGRRPFESIPKDPDEIRERVPTTPGAALRAARKARQNTDGAEHASVSWRQIPRDLDTICLEALRPEPEHRYSSAEELGRDIERYLEGLPLGARRATLGYRLGKFVRRHRQGVIAALVLLALLASGFARERSLRTEAEIARAHADREAAKAVAVSEFLSELLSSADPAKAQGEEVTVAEVLDQASQRLEELDDFVDQPEVEASVRLTIADTYRALSRFDRAMVHVDRAVALGGGVHATTPEALEAVESLAYLHISREEPEQAIPLARQLLAVRTEALGQDHPETLAAMSVLAKALWLQGLYEEVEPLNRKTIEVHKRVLGAEHPDTLRSINSLAATLFYLARYLEAAELFDQLLVAHRRVLGENHPDTLNSANNLAACYMELCYYDKAEQLLRPVLEGRRRVLGEDSPLTWTTTHNLGAVLVPMGRYQEAESLLRKAAESRRGMSGNLRNHYFSRSYLADAVRDQERYDEAEAIYIETLAEQRRRYGEDDSQTLKTVIGLADLRLRQGRLEEAEDLLLDATQRMAGVVDNQHPDLLGGRTILARLRNAQSRPAEALGLAEAVLAGAGPAYDAEHPLMLDTQVEKIVALRALGRLEEAAELAPAVYRGRVNRLGEDHPRTAEALALVRALGGT